MDPARVDLTLRKGDQFQIAFVLSQGSTPINVDSHWWELVVRNDVGDKYDQLAGGDTVYLSATSSGVWNQANIRAEGNRVTVTVPDPVVRGLNFGSRKRGVYSLRYVTQNGTPQTVFEGYAHLKSGAAR